MATSQAADKLATELTAQIDAAKTASQELAELKQVRVCHRNHWRWQFTLRGVTRC